MHLLEIINVKHESSENGVVKKMQWGAISVGEFAEHNIIPEKMLMVGDSKNDIMAAKNAGCLSFGLTYGYNHGEPISSSNPDFVADNISDLIDVVTKCTKLKQNLF